jgi:aerobic carbon-monoxide dehydrogenase medium subunit
MLSGDGRGLDGRGTAGSLARLQTRQNVLQFQYLEPKSLHEVCALLTQHADRAKLLAGGVSLVPLLKGGLVTPDYVIDIKNLPDMVYVLDDQAFVRIGALTTLRALGASPVIQDRFPILVDMERNLFDVQTRNWGTLGGNLCYAGRAGEPAAVLIALGASVKLASSRRERNVELKDFLTGHRASILAVDEILVEILVPLPKRNVGGAYCKEARRPDHSSIVNVATTIRLDEGLARIEDAVIVIGGVRDTPVRLRQTEQLLRGQMVEDVSLSEAGRVASTELQPSSNIRGSAEFKREIAAQLTRKTAMLAIDRCGGSKGRHK